MSQTARTEISKVSDQSKASGNSAADAAHLVADSAKRTTREVAAMTSEAADRHASKATDVAEQVAEASRTTLETANRGGVTLAAFWLQVMQEQTKHNVEAMQSLAEARDWQEKLNIQTSFFSGSLSRLQDVFARYMELAGGMTTDMFRTGTAEVKKTARTA